MTKALCVRLLSSVLICSVSSQLSAADEASSTIVWNNRDRAPAQGLVHGSFNSQSMGVEVGYNVFLPLGYAESERRYPVIYFLHGAGGDENSDAAAFAGVVARLIKENKIPPAICVFPNGGPRSGYRDNLAGKTMVETAIVKELLPLIDQIYRTQPVRASRVIVGFSMGGAGAVRFALKYPELFSAAGAWAGAFMYPRRDDGTLPPDFTAPSIAPVAGRVRIFLVVGTKDSTLDSHPAFLASLTEARFPFQFELLDGVEHDPGAYYDHSGEKMLRFLTTDFPPSLE